MRHKIIAGNWKMNTTPEEGVKLAQQIVATINNSDSKKVILIPPFTHLSAVQNSLKSSQNIYLGAQNCYYRDEGAFTGEISVPILKSLGVKYVIIGHSERRQHFREKNEVLAEKVKACLKHGLTPVYCCGETLQQRENDSYIQIILNQLREGLFHLDDKSLQNVIVAYEPVWAIGTGRTASPKQAQEIHELARSFIRDRYNNETSDAVHILYGGSVKPDTAAEIMHQEDIDGALVGGASLNAADFNAIIEAA